jgi:Derlin-2/3
MMEEGFYRSKPADYLWLLTFAAGTLIVSSVSFELRLQNDRCD